MSTLGTTPYHRDALKEQLIAIAADRVDAGERDVSLREIARTAGVSTAAPYRHFSDRGDLLLHVAARGFDALTAALTAVPGEPADLAALATAYVEFARAFPGRYELMFSRPCAGSELVHESSARTMAAFVERAGLDGQDPSVALAYWSLVHGLTGLLAAGKVRALPGAPVAAVAGKDGDVREDAAVRAVIAAVVSVMRG
ncbi:TetR/AcrR family transcriptional regulator [Mycetocola lacteus]|nr:TetR/AcrR family transcriptional regulator [Mycetocola lacteus]